MTTNSNLTTGSAGEAVLTIPYTYADPQWRDRMTTYNRTATTYDAICNLTCDGTWTYVWEKGRQLKQMSREGSGGDTGETVSFAYNADGLRVQKVCTSTGTTEYTLRGKEIVHVEGSGTDGSSYDLHIFYDAQNRPAVVRYNGALYGYMYNLQGDVVTLIDSAGSKVVEYWYDAWGKPLSKTGTLASTLGTYNPFRYRHYVYDEETGLYYLRSR